MGAKIAKGIFITAILGLLCSPLFAQWADNFDDGNFTINPTWTGNTNDFIIESGELRLNAPAQTGSSSLAALSDISLDASWTFFIRFGFNPSSSNYAKVYLMADVEDLTNVQNGYFVKIGGTSDEISLYKVVGGSETLLINGADGRVSLSNVEIEVSIARDITNNWELESRLVGESNFVSEGNIIDLDVNTSTYFGVFCKYTSTRSTKFYFDDFVVNGSAYVDDEPPFLLNYRTPASNKITLLFNEALDTVEATVNSHFVLNGSFIPEKVIPLSFDTLLILFEQNISLTNSLELIGLTDISGNELDTTLQIIFVNPDPPQIGAIIINEIFPDPSPQEDLPPYEFVELFNNSNNVINLAGWVFSDGSRLANLSEFLFFPDSFLIICPLDAKFDYQLLGPTMGLNLWPTLNNNGDALSVLDPINTLIDSVNYSDDWYKNAEKDEGGWTLEMINSTSRCDGIYNWGASISSSGGTPGKPNSIKLTISDNTPPLINQALLTDSVISLWFTEPIAPGNYLINWTPPVDPINITIDIPTEYLRFKTDDLFVTSVSVKLEDCEGNQTVAVSPLLMISQPQSKNIILNEVLFDPYPEGEDFIELLNTTEFNFNLNGFTLSNEDATKEISDTVLVLKANHYLALSEDILFLKNQYLAPDSSLIESNLPTMPNEEGVIILKTNTLKTLDSVYYSDDFHFSLIGDTEGISLERISSSQPGLDANNWRSAAESTRFATPGYKNAQSGSDVVKGEVSVEPEVITPNNDGQADFCRIGYSLDNQSQTISISVYNLQGQLVKMITRNTVIAPSGFFTWDGTNQQGGVLPTAHYIIVSEVITSDGRVLIYRNKVVVANGF